MNKQESKLLLLHLRRTVRDFALYESVASGACATADLAKRLGMPVPSLQVKLMRARKAAVIALSGFSAGDFTIDEEVQEDCFG